MVAAAVPLLTARAHLACCGRAGGASSSASQREVMQALNEQDWPGLIRPGSRVFLGGGASVPFALVDSMLAKASHFKDIEVVHIHGLGPTPWIDPRFESVLRTNSFFLTPALRDAVERGQADYTPCAMSDVPLLFRDGEMPLGLPALELNPILPGLAEEIVHRFLRRLADRLIGQKETTSVKIERNGGCQVIFVRIPMFEDIAVLLIHPTIKRTQRSGSGWAMFSQLPLTMMPPSMLSSVTPVSWMS